MVKIIRGDEMVRIVVQELWMVIRTDEAGNTFLMREGISKELAEAIVEMYTERGHKQHYTRIVIRLS